MPHAGGPRRRPSSRITSGPAVLKPATIAELARQPPVEEAQAHGREEAGRVLKLGPHADQPVVAGRDRAQPLRQLVTSRRTRWSSGPARTPPATPGGAPPARPGRRTRPPRAAARVRPVNRRSADREDDPTHRTRARRPARTRARLPSSTSVTRPVRDPGRSRPRDGRGPPWRGGWSPASRGNTVVTSTTR